MENVLEIELTTFNEAMLKRYEEDGNWFLFRYPANAGS